MAHRANHGLRVATSFASTVSGPYNPLLGRSLILPSEDEHTNVNHSIDPRPAVHSLNPFHTSPQVVVNSVRPTLQRGHHGLPAFINNACGHRCTHPEHDWLWINHGGYFGSDGSTGAGFSDRTTDHNFGGWNHNGNFAASQDPAPPPPSFHHQRRPRPQMSHETLPFSPDQYLRPG